MTDESTKAESVQATVLVVEDERELADLYAEWISDAYGVQIAYDGEQALAHLDNTVDLVLLDRRMPGLSGDDVLERIRERDLDCRVIIVSAVTPDFDVIGMGFDEYLTKPVTREELHNAVDQMLVRADYDTTVQEYLQLTASRAALEAQKDDAQLRASEEYAELENRIEELEHEAQAALNQFNDEDFEAAFRDLGGSPDQIDSIEQRTNIDQE